MAKFTGLVTLTGAALILALSLPANAQGIVKGAEEGAKVGNDAAGPVGGAVGGVAGGVAGGVVGGVKGVLGIPQASGTRSKPRRTAMLTRTTLRSELVGRPLPWSNDDGSQKGTTVFYTDGTAALTDSNLGAGPTDAGRWTIKSNRLCVTWDKNWPGEERCSTWTRTGNGMFRSSDGIVITPRS